MIGRRGFWRSAFLVAILIAIVSMLPMVYAPPGVEGHKLLLMLGRTHAPPDAVSALTAAEPIALDVNYRSTIGPASIAAAAQIGAGGEANARMWTPVLASTRIGAYAPERRNWRCTVTTFG